MSSEGKENFLNQSSETLIEKLHLKEGRKVSLIKHSLIENAVSKVNVGTTLHGKLARGVRVGEPIQLEGGAGNTSDIQKIYQEGNSYFAETNTSVYEIIPDFEGMSLKNELGEITLPEDAKNAELGDEVVDLPFSSKGTMDKKYQLYINKPALKDILLEIHGGNLFRAVHGRFMVIAKVGNIHLPFYISSEGTSGKKEGKWYPFFGYTGTWLVKGNVDSNGEMPYHPEISKIQNLLNENLIIPANFISARGKMGTGISKGRNEPTKIFFDLNDYMKYQNFFFTEYADEEQKFIERISGYKPEHVSNDNKTNIKWINDVVSKIQKTEL